MSVSQHGTSVPYSVYIRCVPYTKATPRRKMDTRCTHGNDALLVNQDLVHGACAGLEGGIPLQLGTVEAENTTRIIAGPEQVLHRIKGHRRKGSCRMPPRQRQRDTRHLGPT